MPDEAQGFRGYFGQVSRQTPTGRLWSIDNAALFVQSGNEELTYRGRIILYIMNTEDSKTTLEINNSVTSDISVHWNWNWKRPDQKQTGTETEIQLTAMDACDIMRDDWLIDWLSYGLTSHSTQNRSFRRRFSQP